jgi:hypothetical protein
VAAAWLGVPSALLFDYEFATPGVGRPTWIVTPEVIPPGATGRNPKYALRYPGIKEDVYVSRFRPDPALRARLGLADSDLVVVIRPPASEAHYHNPLSDGLLTTTIDHVLSHPSARIVLLPRTKNQDVALRERWAGLLAQGRLVIPPQAVDGLSLIWSADLVVSGGGTMNREAAALGVPVYSIFRGQLGAVDRYLAAEGRLVLVESDEDVRRNVRLVPRPATPPPSSTPRPALAAIVQHIATILDAEPAANAARPRASRRALESV